MSQNNKSPTPEQQYDDDIPQYKQQILRRPPDKLKDDSISPYQCLVRPLPEKIRTQSVVSRGSSNNSYCTREDLIIPHFGVNITVQFLSGLGAVISSALLVPFGAAHADMIHITSFMFGLMYITSGIVAAMTYRWLSSTSIKISFICHLFSILLGIIGFVVGALSLFQYFEGDGSTFRIELPHEDHYDIATYALTTVAMVCAVLEILAACHVVFTIFRYWTKAPDEKALPVHL